MNQAVKQAADILGNQSKLAEKIGISRVTVNQWVTGTNPIPLERCLQVERATNGQVRCEQLRPDIDWSRASADL